MTLLKNAAVLAVFTVLSVLAGVALILLAPFVAALALWVKVTLPGKADAALESFSEWSDSRQDKWKKLLDPDAGEDWKREHDELYGDDS